MTCVERYPIRSLWRGSSLPCGLPAFALFGSGNCGDLSDSSVDAPICTDFQTFADLGRGPSNAQFSRERMLAVAHSQACCCGSNADYHGRALDACPGAYLR